MYRSVRTFSGSNSITPKGDGNSLNIQVASWLYRMFKFHYPERGRKLFTAKEKLNQLIVQIPLPRKGTETGNYFLVPCLDWRSNSITPKGDGNRNNSLSGIPVVDLFKFHYPERGRKRLSQKAPELLTPGSNSITPKGDGKRTYPREYVDGCYKFKFHYPERGRKRHAQQHNCSIHEVQIPLPRKGTETQVAHGRGRS